MAKKKEVVFVKGTRPTVVWDAKNDRALAEFVNGLYTTSNPRQIKILKEEGYETTDDFPHGPPKEGFEHQKTTLAPPKPISDLTPSTLEQHEEEADVPLAKKADVGKGVKNQISQIKKKPLRTKTTGSKRTVKRRKKSATK